MSGGRALLLLTALSLLKVSPDTRKNRLLAIKADCSVKPSVSKLRVCFPRRAAHLKLSHA